MPYAKYPVAFSVLLVVVLLANATTESASEAGVIATGAATIQGREMQIVEEEATQTALRNVVRRSLQALLTDRVYQTLEPSLEVELGVDLSEFVRKYTVLSTKRDETFVTVQVKALVASDKLSERLQALPILRTAMPELRVGIVVHESHYGLPADPAHVPVALLSGLAESDLKLIDLDSVISSAEAGTTGEAIRQIRDACREMAVDIIVLGSADVTAVSGRFSKLFPEAHVDLTMKAMMVETGEILLTTRMAARAAEDTKELAALEACNQAAQSAAKKFSSELYGKWMTAIFSPQTVHLIVRNVTYREWLVFEALVAETISGMQRFQWRAFDPETQIAVADVDWRGNISEFIHSLSSDAFTPLEVQIIGYEGNRLTIEIGVPDVELEARINDGTRDLHLTLAAQGSDSAEQPEQGAPTDDRDLTLEPITEIDRPTDASVLPASDESSIIASPAQLPQGERWALVVGINQYEDDDIQSLQYAVADADAVSDVLSDPLYGGFEHVRLLTDTASDKPTRLNILKALRNWLSQAREEDMVLIYFSSHGMENQEGKYLLPQDTTIELVSGSAISNEDFVDALDSLKAQLVVVILDACHSGGVSRSGKGVGETLGMHYYDVFRKTRGRVMLASCAGDEQSYEIREKGHGIFTYYLAQGMKGDADISDDGVVTFHELSDYVQRNVSRWASSMGVSQTPQIHAERVTGRIPVTLQPSKIALKQTENVIQELWQLVSSDGGPDSLTAQEWTQASRILRKPIARKMSATEQQHYLLTMALHGGTMSVPQFRRAIRYLSSEDDTSPTLLAQLWQSLTGEPQQGLTLAEVLYAAELLEKQAEGTQLDHREQQITQLVEELIQGRLVLEDYRIAAQELTQ